MHYFLSSLLAYLLTPFYWLAALTCLGFLAKSAEKRKRYAIAALMLFLLFSNNWLLISYARYWQQPNTKVSSSKTYSSAILLGGFGSPGASEEGYFNGTADRFIQAAKQYKLGKIQHILISGGNGKNEVATFNEASWAKKELMVFGIPDSAILVEDASANTADNAAIAKKILDSLKLTPPYLLITSAHHMPRASLLFKKAGLNTHSLSCNYISGNEKYRWEDCIPRADVLFNWSFYFKETFAYWLYRLKG